MYQVFNLHKELIGQAHMFLKFSHGHLYQLERHRISVLKMKTTIKSKTFSDNGILICFRMQKQFYPVIIQQFSKIWTN